MTFSSQWTPKQDEAWKKLRSQGENLYILHYGVLRWGIITAFLFSVLRLALSNPKSSEEIIITFILSIILFPIAGYFVGLYTWRKNETQHERFNSRITPID